MRETIGDSSDIQRQYRTIRVAMILFIVGLVLSGLTAFPLKAEIDWLAGTIGATPGAGGILGWVATVRAGVDVVSLQQPWLFYGTDWLAFGHLCIALFFFGPLRDPVRNVFVLRAGVAACILVWPIALICGPIRGIPFWWQLIDCSFGVLGLVPLLIALRGVRQLEAGTASGG